ncbi:MAG: metallophosphoesterase family protein, partial [Armatimonadetes bacterium]|nr:metallophosphoesterase family protein [Armatimonadota bacterium]
AELFRAEWDASRDALDYVRSLPPTRRVATVAGELLLCHGFGADDIAGIYPGGDDAPIAEALATLPGERPRILIAGHTHRRMIRTVLDVTIINPGSLVGDKESPGFAVADFGARTVAFYEMGTNGAATPDAHLSYNENL